MAVNWAIRDANDSDPWVFAQKLRARDREEVVATAGPDVLATLKGAIAVSKGMCWAASTNRDGRVLLLGCAPVEGVPGLGSPWLLGAEAADQYPGALTKIAKRHIAIMLGTYSALHNYVDERNAASVRWLERLGFRVGAAEPYGVERRPFHPFSMGDI